MPSSSPLRSAAETVRGTFERRPLLYGAILLFAVLATIYIASIDIRATRGASITGDEPFYLLTTQSLVKDGDFDLLNQYEQKSYREFFDHPDGLWRQSVPNDDGELLSPHDPGLSIYVIPGFVIDRSARPAGPTPAHRRAHLRARLRPHRAAHRVTASASWIATAAVGLSATAFVYSTEVYPEIPGACLPRPRPARRHAEEDPRAGWTRCCSLRHSPRSSGSA